MPDRRTHLRYHSYAAPVAVTMALAVWQEVGWAAGAVFMGGYVLGRWVEPDLDLAENRKVSLSPHGLWNLYWLPYGLLFRHRSMWTHLPIVGSALRALYLLFLPAIMTFVILRPTPLQVMMAGDYLFWFVMGLSAADFVHAMADTLLYGERT